MTYQTFTLSALLYYYNRVKFYKENEIKKIKMDDILALICQLYETSTLHCFCCDPKYAILWSNRSGETFEQKEKLTELFHENELRELFQRLAEGKSCELTRKEFLKSNSVYHFTPFLKDNALILILVTLEDTAQDRKNDQSIYDFCSSISAEYRTALFGVFNLLSVLAQDFEAREMYGQLEMVNSIAYHCYKILRATLNTSAFYLLKSSDAPLNLKPVNLNLYLENLCSSIRMRLQNTEIQFRYELDPEPVNSMIDTEKFDLLIFNLLSNSCIYTNPGNEIKLTMKKMEILTLSLFPTKGLVFRMNTSGRSSRAFILMISTKTEPAASGLAYT